MYGHLDMILHACRIQVRSQWGHYNSSRCMSDVCTYEHTCARVGVGECVCACVDVYVYVWMWMRIYTCISNLCIYLHIRYTHTPHTHISVYIYMIINAWTRINVNRRTYILYVIHTYKKRNYIKKQKMMNT